MGPRVSSLREVTDMSTKTVLTIQGLYYFLTGIWPIIHIKSFQWVTGPKVDLWLVKTVSLLIVASSCVFLISGLKSAEASQEILWLALLNAIFLTLIDVVYAMKGIKEGLSRRRCLTDCIDDLSLVGNKKSHLKVAFFVVRISLSGLWSS